MRTVTDHQDAVRELLEPLRARASERVSAVVTGGQSGILDRVLADDLLSPIDHPPFDNSQMDGYAIRTAELEPGVPLAVAPRIAAGASEGILTPGTAAPIMTGAPVPEGADAIVPIEQATPDRFQEEGEGRTVQFADAASAGAFVRPRGSDLPEGGLLLEAGTRLGPAQWAVLAASGITEVNVLRRVRVLVLSTGDELQQPGIPLRSGQVYDANRSSMALAVERAGGVAHALHSVTDDAAALAALLASAAVVDLVLTTGGVSKGAYEVVREVLEPAGVVFSSVAMQPGGPQGIGLATLAGRSVPVIAFPGNPVSALVSFEVFLAPVLRSLHGLAPRRPAVAELAEPLESPAGKHQVRRGQLDDDGRVRLVGGPSSHLLHHYATSTHLVHVPLGVSTLAAGDGVEIWSIDD